MVLKRAESSPCISLNVCSFLLIFQLDVIPLIFGWTELFLACVAHIAAWKPSSFLHVPGSTCSVVPVHQKPPWKGWRQHGDIHRWRHPCVGAEAAFDLGYSVAVWTAAPHPAAAFGGVFGSPPLPDCDGLWSCLQQAWRVRNSLGIYYWILNSVQKMRKGLHGTLLL